LIDDSDSDQDDLSFAFGKLSNTMSSTSTSSRYYTCNLFFSFCLISMFNLFSVRVVLTLVAMICDVLILVVLYVMNYIMVLIWKLPNISTVNWFLFQGVRGQSVLQCRTVRDEAEGPQVHHG
jgi:hypothetical protein